MTRFLIPAVLLAGAMCWSSCNNTPKAPENAYTPYFPVNAFLAQQLQQIDSLQQPTTLYTIQGKDTAVQAISMAECRDKAAPFLETDISTAALHDKYKEESFADQSSASITFNYTATDSSLSLQRTDVVLKPDPVLTDRVKSVYMEKNYRSGDTLVSEKLYWKADHFYQVIRSTSLPGVPEKVVQQKVVWDPAD